MYNIKRKNMDMIHCVILDMSKNIQINLNVSDGQKFIKTKTLSPEEGIRQAWQGVGDDIRFAMNNFEENEKLETTK